MEPRILDGERAPELEWGFMVALVSRADNRTVLCGGALLDNTTVLTGGRQGHPVPAAAAPAWWTSRTGASPPARVPASCPARLHAPTCTPQAFFSLATFPALPCLLCPCCSRALRGG